VTPTLSGASQVTGWRNLAKPCLVSGWPIALANTGVNLIQSADRLAVSWSTNIQNFAVYSLAASLMTVPLMIIQVFSKVFFSHLAGLEPQRRERIYAISELTFLALWAILLPFYFALQIFLMKFLPKYASGLVYARVLLLGIPFLATIQILQMSLAFLNRMQRKFLARTLLVLVAGIGLMLIATFCGGSLLFVAATQVLLLGGWWILNEWTLRSVTAQRKRDWLKFLLIYLLICTSYWITTAPGVNVAVGVSLYYLVLFVILTLGFKEQLTLWFQQIKGARTAQAEGK
jgi:O-antigen/teichoic acid export membrane protein